MRRAVAITAIVLAALGALGIRVVVEGRRALVRGDDAYADGRVDDAIAGWEAAGRWYLPLAPHVDDAYVRLSSLASVEPRYALAAWRAIRSAALATRGLWSPYDDLRREADARIAELSARDPEGAAAGGSDAVARRGVHAARLDAPTRPHGLAVAAAIAGIVTWLAGLAVVVRRGFRDDGLRRRPAVVGAVLAAVGVLVWTLGLYNA